MRRVGEQEDEIEMNINHYRKEMKKQTKKYCDLKEKYEKLKILELNLRYEIYQLKQKLTEKQFIQVSNLDKEVQTHPSAIIFEKDSVDVLDMISNQLILYLYEWNLKQLIHRPIKDNKGSIGLGKEIMLLMSDNHEKNDQIEGNSLSKKEATKLSIADGEDVNSDQQKINQSPLKRDIKNFNDLKELVSDLNTKEQKVTHKPDISISDKDQFTSVDSVTQSKNFTFRDLQKAEQIYSKPKLKMNTKTTTSIKREVNHAFLKHNGSTGQHKNTEQETSDLTTSTDPEVQERQAKDSTTNIEIKERNMETNVQETQHSNLNDMEEDNQQFEESKPEEIEKENQQIEDIEFQNDVTNHQELGDNNIQKNPQHNLSESENEKQSTNEQQESLIVTERKTNESISDEIISREGNDLENKQLKHDSFFKSLLKKFR